MYAQFKKRSIYSLITYTFYCYKGYHCHDFIYVCSRLLQIVSVKVFSATYIKAINISVFNQSNMDTSVHYLTVSSVFESIV